MTTKQMEYALALAKTGNFNRAAEALYISQPTLTYQIKALEEEIGFALFSRSGKGAMLTPAGKQFLTTLSNIQVELREAIDQGQNFASKYQDDIRILLPVRSALYYLPQAMMKFQEKRKDVSITPGFLFQNGLEAFLRGEWDLFLTFSDVVEHVSDIVVTPLYESHIDLVVRNDDPLSQKRLITSSDLKGRTLMVGGPSQAPLKRVQNQAVRESGCDYMNSDSHDMSLTYVSSKRAIVLSPDFLDDHSHLFSWIPFDTKETISCVICSHPKDKRESVKEFLSIVQSFYPKKE